MSPVPTRDDHERIVACIYLPRLPLSCLDLPEAENTVVVVRPERGDDVIRGVMRIADCSDDLRAIDVAPPMRILDAQLYAPALDVQVVGQKALMARLTTLAELCHAHAPLVEIDPEALNVIYLDFTGVPAPVSALLGGVYAALGESGERCVIGASSGKRFAAALARAAHQANEDASHRGDEVPPWPILYVPEARRAAAMARLPLSTTDISPDLKQSLRRLGLKTVEDLNRLKKADLAPRLFKEGKKTLDLLALWDREPVQGMTFASEVAEERDFDFGILKLESLLFVLLPLCERLCRRVSARGEELLAATLELQVTRPYGAGRGDDAQPVCMSATFPEPLRAPRALLEALSLRLSREGLPGEVHRVRLVAARTTVRVARQPTLFVDLQRAPTHIPDELAGFMAELVSEFDGAHVGALHPHPSFEPSALTRLSWPPRAGLPPGHFLQRWPWPLQVLKRPVPLRTEDVRARSAFAILDVGNETNVAAGTGRRFERYALADGRTVMGFWDEEEEAYFLQAFFD